MGEARGDDARGAEAGRLMDRVARVDARVWLHTVAGLTTLGLAVLICATGESPRAGLERWCSDHYSHTGTTVLFLEQGLDIYRKPVRAHCVPPRGRDWRERRAQARRMDVNPIDLCVRKSPGSSSAQRPLVINWQKLPRPYPPGVMLYFLPEALLWEHTGASFRTINSVTIVKLLVVGHLAWVVLVILLSGFKPRGVAWAIMAMGYSQLIYWSAVGIYDGVAILFVLLCLLALQRGRGSLAILALAAACVMHFRSLWYLPLLAPGMLCVILKRELGDRKQLLWLALAGVLFAVTAYVFWILWPALKIFPPRNPFDYKKFSWGSPVFMSVLVPTFGVAMLLAWRRLWLGLTLVLWMTVFFLRTPQIMTWHALFLLPLLAVPTVSRVRGGSPETRLWDPRLEQLFVSLIWYFLAAAMVFKATVWPTWIASVFRRLGLG